MSRLNVVLRWLVVLNTFDLGLTLTLVSLKWATEANPLLSYVLQSGPMAFVVFKASLSVFSILLLWRGRKSRWALPAGCFCLGCYSLAVLYEIAVIIIEVLTGGSALL